MMNADIRRTAWAPVGTDIAGAKTIDEALEMAGLNFEVVKNPIFTADGSSIPTWYATTRTDDGTVLGMVRDKYKVVQNRDAFDFTNDLVAEGVEFEKAGLWHSGTSMWVEAKLPREYSILGDDVDAHVVFVNSHDGKGSVKVLMVPNRLACSNQLNLAIANAPRSWSAVHSSKVDSKLAVARETLGLADKYMTELEKQSEILALTSFSDDAFDKIIDRIYPITADLTPRKIATIEEVRDGLHACLRAEDDWEYRNTAYGKIMAVTDYFDHCMPKRNTDTYLENNWQSIANGHPMVDRFHKEILQYVG